MSLFCWGMFNFLRSNFESLTDLHQWCFKPLFTCIICAATFWGNIAYWLMPEPHWGEWVVAWVGCSAVNWFLAHWFDV